MSDFKSDAHDMCAADQLRSAARLVERAIIQLNMAEAPCPNCNARLFADRESARVYEGLSDTPDRLRKTAERIDEAKRTGARPSNGYAAASAAKRLVLVNAEPDPRD